MLEDIIRNNKVKDPVKRQTITSEIKCLMKFIKGECSRSSLQKILKIDNRNLFHTYYINASLNAGLIEKTYPDKPQIAFQKYRLTEKGLILQRKLLKEKN